MGKLDEQQLPVQQQQDGAGGGSRIFCRQRCSVGLSRIFGQISFKCIAVLLLSFAVFFSTLFVVIPLHSKPSGFDAKHSIVQSASIQAYFKLEKPVSELIPQIPRLEYDINGEIGVPFTKVVVLSMHQASGVSNWSDVVFGFISDTMNASVDPVSFAVLKSSLIDLFLQQSNLTLTNSTFGQPSSFEILKFPGGITIIPKQSVPIFQIPQILFNFTLNNSMFEINENFIVLKDQLKSGLHLRPYENIYIQVTNKNGSTRDPPVTVEASVTSDSGSLSPQRLRQLAQIISRSPSRKNLGLDHAVFGKVKEVSLSSYFNHSIHAAPPSPCPSPSPDENNFLGPSLSPSPAVSPSPSSIFPCSPDVQLPPSPENEPPQSLPPMLGSPAPTTDHCGTPLPSRHSPMPHASALPPLAPTRPSQIVPGPSPLPVGSYASSRGPEKVNRAPPPVFTSISPSPSSFAISSFHREIWWFCLIGLLTSHLLSWTF